MLASRATAEPSIFRSHSSVTPLSRLEPQRQARRHYVYSYLLLAVLLGFLRWGIPPVVEEVRYAWERGQLRAQYETSGEGLAISGLEQLSQAYQMVSQRVGPSVVNIDVTPTRGQEVSRRWSDGNEGAYFMPGDQGSGVIVDPDGFILTNRHVIRGGSEIRIGLSDGRRLLAEVIGSDEKTDLAVLKVDARDLLAIEWADSDALQVGSPVWAVGSPFGLDHTITFGILSGKNRDVNTDETYKDFMQSDVAVNPGNSGGPLVDALGRLVGINTAIIGDTYSGVSFSIPSNVARVVYDRIREYGEMRRGWLGVGLVDASSAVASSDEALGAVVTQLTSADSPAALAGLRKGDRIIGFNGLKVRDMRHLMRLVGDAGEGNVADLDVIRDDTSVQLRVKLGVRQQP